jgi:hypothetical protein
MKFKKSLKLHRTIFLIILFVLIILIAGVPTTFSSSFIDFEDSLGNFMNSTKLDLVFKSDEGDFETDVLGEDENSLEREYEVKNEGDTPFVYGLRYKEKSSEDNECGSLDLKVTYIYFDSTEEHKKEIYLGSLGSFNIKYEDSEDFEHMELEPGESNLYLFEIFYFDDRDESDDIECSFEIIATAWQKEYTSERAFWDEEDIPNNIEIEDDEDNNKGNHCEGIDVKDVYNGDSLTTYSSENEELIEGICIKSGTNMFEGDHSDKLTEDGTYEEGCYRVTGIGTSTVIVEKLLPGKHCQDISHIDIYLSEVD